MKTVRSPTGISAAKTVVSPKNSNFASNKKLAHNKSPKNDVSLSTDIGSKTTPAQSRKSQHNFTNTFSLNGATAVTTKNSRSRLDLSRKSMNCAVIS